MSTSKINFSVKLVKAIFKDDQLINRNVHGCRGRLALDPVKLLKVRKIYFKTFPSEDEEAEWLKCVNAINSHLRKYVKEQVQQVFHTNAFSQMKIQMPCNTHL